MKLVTICGIPIAMERLQFLRDLIGTQAQTSAQSAQVSLFISIHRPHLLLRVPTLQPLCGQFVNSFES